MNRLINKPVITLFFITLLSSCAHHDTKKTEKNAKKQTWSLNKEYSSISIVTTKNNSISEVSDFQSFSGSISDSGYLNIEIDLNSLETNIPIRNERIQKLLFRTDIYPSAEIHTQLKPEDLEVGVHKISFDVDLHGVSNILEAEFMVFDQFGSKIITLHKPLIIQANSFALIDGIDELKKLAALNNISYTVPLNIVLSFKPN